MMFELWYEDINNEGLPLMEMIEADSEEEAFERWINFRDFSEIIGKPVRLIELKKVIENKI